MARRNKAQERAIAKQRIQRLLSMAEDAALAHRLEDAGRLLELAWALKTRYVLPTPPQLKARYCRGCHGYLLPGRTARTRLRAGKVTTTCLGCGSVRRRPMGFEHAAPAPPTRDR